MKGTIDGGEAMKRCIQTHVPETFRGYLLECL